MRPCSTRQAIRSGTEKWRVLIFFPGSLSLFSQGPLPLPAEMAAKGRKTAHFASDDAPLGSQHGVVDRVMA